MKNKTLLFISLVLSSSILHAELNPLSGAGTDMVKDSVTGAVKEKVTDSAKDMVKGAITPAAPTDASKDTEATSPAGGEAQAIDTSATNADTQKTPSENAPATTEEPVKAVKNKAHKKSSRKHR
jgi:predicted small secreted protein